MRRPRKRSAAKSAIRRRALRIEQNDKHPLYVFCLTGDEILEVADISRLSRDDAGKLIGYQRADVKRHIQDIVEYLNSDDILFPNSLILALSSKVKFHVSRGPLAADGLVASGVVEIPLSKNGHKPAWIVDGQQRALAISKSTRRDMPIPVNAFVADEVELQRDQFLRVNNTKPLPRGLITELLPEVSTPLPANLQAKKGSRYQSLSQIARLITGTRWSGPLFFGIKGKQSAAPRGRANEL
ncbi:MAG TPA: DGQHR domain-containing protein [Terracidiphilus sp.]|jgi:DGQHR domain-containing protein